MVGSRKILKKIARALGAARLRDYLVTHRLICEAKRSPDLKLHLGCATYVLQGWLNIDFFPRPGVARLRLPKGMHNFEDNSVRYVYTSHFLEHLDYRTDALLLAKECHRVLVPGGILRIVVPGIERIIRAYVADDEAFFAQQRTTHPPWCETKLEILMNALQQNGSHKYGYDFETISKLLKTAGFSSVNLSDYNTSETAELKVDYRGKGLSLFVEAVK